jgi:hypothetical protein
MARAKIAVDATIRLGLPPEGFVEGGSGLEDLERRHVRRPLGLIIRFGEDD